MSYILLSPKKTIFGWAAILAAGASATPAMAVIESSVVSYNLGQAVGYYADYNDSSSALNFTNGDLGWGSSLNAYSAPYDVSDLVYVGPGGQITLQFSSAVSVTSALQIGVFTMTGFNYGLVGVSSTVELYSTVANKAIVLVGSDLSDMKALNNGQPIDLAMITNAYSDSVMSGLDDYGYPIIPPGTQDADYYTPYAGSIDDLWGLDYSALVAALGGSAGGYWLDVSSTQLSSIQYIQFVVPTDADYALMLDAVTVIPEPASAALLVFGTAALLRRRR